MGFEPIVIDEPKQLRSQREASREKLALIEKPKGCDIAIATRMVADAAAGLYDACFLFTSDADFLPAVEAVRRMGKVVGVFGVESALGKNSAYLHVPDFFFDLEDHLRHVWHNGYGQIKRTLESMGETGPLNEPVR
jgi:uncharacterized LabA/DUF88 family protein